MEQRPQEITSLVGREVYTKNGVFVGEVEDLKLNLDVRTVTGLAVGSLSTELFEQEASQGQGVVVPYRWVRAVGDVILVADVVERVREPDDEEEVVA
ncbi:PRC-barrel domain-containing protein [Halovivax cerinus]|uniref:PRC-barrel domain-containing protein n=1 Tax=Halovivax cerinus TaxID=1487865 RepID=A0ABD5NT58_9EURY|nr:PRC-barrel domain-containing protein [Halovivax cerinus]